MLTLLSKRIALKHIYAVLSTVLLFLGTALIAAYAGGGGNDIGLGELADNVKGNLGPIETLIISICYIGGIGFAGAAIMKFKQYKDNPQQIQLGQPIALAFIAAALIWLPQLVKTAGTTIFGSSSGAGSAEQSSGIFE